MRLRINRICAVLRKYVTQITPISVKSLNFNGISKWPTTVLRTVTVFKFHCCSITSEICMVMLFLFGRQKKAKEPEVVECFNV